jgi:hypothetical protein
MPTITHDTPVTAPERRPWRQQVLVREMWASLAICVMWIAVVFSVLFGPDFVSTTPGGSSTTIPSGIAVALFAVIGTHVVASRAFGRQRDD